MAGAAATKERSTPCMTAAPAAAAAAATTTNTTTITTTPPFFSLPAELILHCLQHLDPLDLIAVSETCHALRKSCSTDTLWQRLVNANLALPATSPGPLASFKQLYISHHACWFVASNRLWISDSEPSGKLVLSLYNARTGTIEAHTLVATRGEHTITRWSEDQNVLIHAFSPVVGLHTDAPVLRLTPTSPKIEVPEAASRRGVLSTGSSSQSAKRIPNVARETLMDCASYNSPGLKSAFLLARDIPSEAITSGSAVWPPLLIPSRARARNLSGSEFSSVGHRPSSLSQVSQSAFRIRKWVDYHNRRDSSNAAQMHGVDRLAAAAGLGFGINFTSSIPRGLQADRRGDHVTTFGALDPKLYTPTAQKPWRGIWCGDYSGHGCEFVLVMQPDAGEEFPLPRGLNWLKEWLSGARLFQEGHDELAARTYSRMHQILTNMVQRDGFHRRDPRIYGRDPNAQMPADDDDEDEEDGDIETDNGSDIDMQSQEAENDPSDASSTRTGSSETASASNGAIDPTADDLYSGQLIAVKLTGDPHIPRGQITFIAPDLGDKALVRIAHEEPFAGARVVRSAGHVANRGFMHDEYICSQLLLVSHDRLAQYWPGFGHISHFVRVDVAGLMAAADREVS